MSLAKPLTLFLVPVHELKIHLPKAPRCFFMSFHALTMPPTVLSQADLIPLTTSLKPLPTPDQKLPQSLPKLDLKLFHFLGIAPQKLFQLRLVPFQSRLAVLDVLPQKPFQPLPNHLLKADQRECISFRAVWKNLPFLKALT